MSYFNNLRKVIANQGGGLLLDLYPGAAAAYSVRLIRSGYSGSCIRVRRSSDDAEQDIGFSGGSLDTSSLLSFVGSGDGFVKTWYDQGVNGNNFSITTKADQPRIVISGTLQTQNGISKIKSDFNNVYLEALSLNRGSSIGDATIFSVINYDSLSNTSRVVGFGNNDVDGIGGAVHLNPAGDYSLRFDGASISGSLSPTSNQIIRTTVKDGTTYYDWINNQNNINGSSVADGGIVDDFYAFPLDGKGSAQEIIVYLSDKRTDRTDIESNINDYFGVF